MNINDIAQRMDTTATYLLGYQKEESPLTNYLSILEMMFKLEELEQLGFEIDVKRPHQYEKWECSIIFNGKDKATDLNADLCLFLEDWKEHRKNEDMQNPSKQYSRWKDQTLAYTVTAENLKEERISSKPSSSEK